jgi:hypothetical protein
MCSWHKRPCPPCCTRCSRNHTRRTTGRSCSFPRIDWPSPSATLAGARTCVSNWLDGCRLWGKCSRRLWHGFLTVTRIYLRYTRNSSNSTSLCRNAGPSLCKLSRHPGIHQGLHRDPCRRIPMVEGLIHAGEGEISEFGKATFKNTDWTRGGTVFRVATPDALLLFVVIPGRPTNPLQLCEDRHVHIRPRLFQ